MPRVRLDTPFDLRPFTDLLSLFAPATESGQPLGHINIDVLKTKDAFVVDAELPGVLRDAIHVKVDRNQVESSAQARPRSLAERQRFLARERHEGLFYRSFRLPREVDPERATGRFADGVLELVLPKKAGARREVRIQ
jgi:HSP20 family protein